MAFKGKREFPEVPIHKGSKKGSIKITIDGNDTIPSFTIMQNITDKSSSLTIEPLEVLKGETPRSFLDKIIGSISFDPLEFINQEGKKQRKVLMELCGINVDELGKREKEVFDERTIKGRELKSAEAKVKGLRVWNDVKETEEVKVADLSKKLTEAMTFNQDVKNRETANQKLRESGVKDKEEIENINIQIFKLQNKVDELEKSLASKKEQYRIENGKLDEIEPMDIESLNAELQSIESKNSKIRDNITYTKENASLATTQAAYGALDTELESIRANRIKMIQEAVIPVPGLTFDEDGLLYNSIPLSQCSDGAKLMIGTAISMALNPTMRVLRIRTDLC